MRKKDLLSCPCVITISYHIGKIIGYGRVKLASFTAYYFNCYFIYLLPLFCMACR